jgi:hypothetical protein
MESSALHATWTAPPKVAAGQHSLLWTFGVSIVIWAFDLKADHHEAVALQGLILLIYGTLFLRIVFTAARAGIGVGPVWVLILAIALFMTESSLVGLYRGQPGYAISINLIPVFLYASAAASTYMVLCLNQDHGQGTLQVLRVACLASAIGHLAVVTAARGHLDFATTRYEVLSGAIVPSLGLIAVGLTQRLTLLDLLVLLFSLAVSLLSVTRSLLIEAGAQIALVVLARPLLLVKRSTLKGVMLLALVGLSVVALDLAAGTGLTTRWTERMSLSHKLGVDPSALLRIAETHYMWDHFTATTQTLWFGNGLAAVTSAVGREAMQAASLVGTPSAQIHMIGIGHENYVSVLYVSGLAGGAFVLLMQCLNGLQSLMLVRRLQLQSLLYTPAEAFLGMWGAIIIIGFLAVGLGAGTFQDRGECLWFGIGSGVLYWVRELKRGSAYATTVRSRPPNVMLAAASHR